MGREELSAGKIGVRSEYIENLHSAGVF
jgi:hypothetical protein